MNCTSHVVQTTQAEDENNRLLMLIINCTIVLYFFPLFFYRTGPVRFNYPLGCFIHPLLFLQADMFGDMKFPKAELGLALEGPLSPVALVGLRTLLWLKFGR